MDLGSKLSYSNPNIEASIENTMSLSDMERLDLNNNRNVPIFSVRYYKRVKLLSFFEKIVKMFCNQKKVFDRNVVSSWK